MSKRRLLTIAMELVIALSLNKYAYSQDLGARYSSETKYGDAEVCVQRLVSDIVYTLERANIASDSLSAKAQGQAGVPDGIIRVYHATAMRKLQQLRSLLEANQELGTEHASLLRALERTSQLDLLRESNAAEMKEDEQGDDYWEERLRAIGVEILPYIVSNRAKRVRSSPQADGDNTEDK